MDHHGAMLVLNSQRQRKTSQQTKEFPVRDTGDHRQKGHHAKGDGNGVRLSVGEQLFFSAMVKREIYGALVRHVETTARHHGYHTNDYGMDAGGGGYRGQCYSQKRCRRLPSRTHTSWEVVREP